MHFRKPAGFVDLFELVFIKVDDPFLMRSISSRFLCSTKAETAWGIPPTAT